MRAKVNTEFSLYQQVEAYMKLKYPNVLRHWDLMGVNNPSQYTRGLYSRLNSRSWPDLFVAKPGTHYGLFLELKKEGVKIYKKDGSYVSDLHIQEQAAVLEQLRLAGYAADFACGFDAAREAIDNYLGGSS